MCITFKSRADLSKLDVDDPAYPVADWLIKVLIDEFSSPGGRSYDPENDGYIILVESGDTNRVLDEIDMPWRLDDAPWDSAFARQGMICAQLIGTDDCGWSFMFPENARWLNGKLRETLEGMLD